MLKTQCVDKNCWMLSAGERRGGSWGRPHPPPTSVWVTPPTKLQTPMGSIFHKPIPWLLCPAACRVTVLSSGNSSGIRSNPSWIVYEEPKIRIKIIFQNIPFYRKEYWIEKYATLALVPLASCTDGALRGWCWRLDWGKWWAPSWTQLSQFSSARPHQRRTRNWTNQTKLLSFIPAFALNYWEQASIALNWPN